MALWIHYSKVTRPPWPATQVVKETFSYHDPAAHSLLKLHLTCPRKKRAGLGR